MKVFVAVLGLLLPIILAALPHHAAQYLKIFAFPLCVALLNSMNPFCSTNPLDLKTPEMRLQKNPEATRLTD